MVAEPGCLREREVPVHSVRAERAKCDPQQTGGHTARHSRSTNGTSRHQAHIPTEGNVSVCRVRAIQFLEGVPLFATFEIPSAASSKMGHPTNPPATWLGMERHAAHVLVCMLAITAGATAQLRGKPDSGQSSLFERRAHDGSMRAACPPLCARCAAPNTVSAPRHGARVKPHADAPPVLRLPHTPPRLWRFKTGLENVRTMRKGTPSLARHAHPTPARCPCCNHADVYRAITDVSGARAPGRFAAVHRASMCVLGPMLCAPHLACYVCRQAAQ